MSAVALNQNSNRKYYLDLLRIAATLGVMVLHITAQNWHQVEIASIEWQTFNALNGLARWALPIFAMISGALFLGREVKLKVLFSKYILRIVIAFMFWSALYALIDLQNGMSLSKSVVQLIKGHYHMWYLMMIVGLYLIVPFLKQIAEKESLTKYFLGLSALLTYLLPQLTALLSVTGKQRYYSLLTTLTGNMEFHFTLGFSAYMLLGYYLDQKEFDRHRLKQIYLIGLLGLILSIVGNSLLDLAIKQRAGKFYHYFTINIFCVSAVVFLFFKYKVAARLQNPKLLRLICALSKYSFGAYLVHAMVLEHLKKWFGLQTLAFQPLAACLGLLVLVAVISFAISAVLNAIPKLSRYIV